MGKFISAILLSYLCSASISADWSTSPTVWGPITDDQITLEDVYTSYDPINLQLLATWISTGNAIYASVFDSNYWTAPVSVGGTGAGNVYSAYNSNGQAVATWLDNGTKTPMYAIYDSGWGSPAAITGASAVTAGTTVFVSCNANVDFPSRTDFLATWVDTSSMTAFFSIYDGTTWSSPMSFASMVTSSTVFSAADYSGNFIATWNSGGTPTTSYYSSGAWASAQTMIPGPGTGVLADVFVSANTSATNVFLATWADSITQQPYYSFTDSTVSPPGQWNIPAAISTSSEAIQDVASCYDTLSGLFMATWADPTTTPANEPFYAFFSSTWDAASPITTHSQLNPPTNNNVFVTFYGGPYAATWGDTAQLPIFSFYALDAPYFTGVQLINNFGTVYERYNSLSWTAPAEVVEYKVYRGSQLIATLGAKATSYDDHDQPKESQVYFLTAVTKIGATPFAIISVGANE